MAQIINEYRGLGNALGSGLGAGIGETLGELANAKLKQFARRQESKPFQQLHKGITPEIADLLHAIGPKNLPAILPSILDELNRTGNSEAAGQIQKQLSPPEPTGMQNLAGFNVGDLLTSPNVSPLIRQALSKLPIPPGSMPNQTEQPQQQQQMQASAQPEPEPDKPNIGAAIAKGLRGAKPLDQELKERKQTFVEQQALKPFLNKKNDQYTNDRAIEKVAKEAEVLLKKIHKKFPVAFRRALTGDAQRLLEQDADVREYVAKLGEIVLRTGNSRKGLPSNFKLKLEQAAKADFSQPYQTQSNLLKAIQDRATESRGEQKYISSLKNTEGVYPRDTESKVTAYEMAMDYPLENPEFFSDNTVIEVDGKRYRKKNGQWQEA